MKDRLKTAFCPPFYNYRSLLAFACGALVSVLLFSETNAFLNWFLALIAAIIAVAAIFLKKRALLLFAAALSLFIIRTSCFFPDIELENGMYVISGRVIFEGEKPVIENVRLNSTSYRFNLQINADVPLKLGDTVYTYGFVRFTAGMEESYKSYYNARKIFAVTRIKRPYSVKTPGLFNTLSDVRQNIENKIDEGFNNGAFIKGMLLGDSTDIDYQSRAVVSDAGIAHILALSGLHVSIIAGLLTFLLRFVNKWVRFLLLGAFLFLYTAMTGFSPSLSRASIMFLCYLFGKNIYRRPDTLSSLSLAFIIIVSINPYAIFSASFALSFSATLGILLLGGAIIRLTEKLPLKSVTASIAVSVGASAGTFAPFSFYFSRIPILSPIANLIAIPAATVAIVSAFAGVLLSLIYHPLLIPFAFVADKAVELLMYIAKLVASISFSVIDAPTAPFVSGVLVILSMAFVSSFFLKSTVQKLIFAGATLVIAIICFYI